jgi:hypothetical protein
MISPQEVRARCENIGPYEQQIDQYLAEPWTDEMQRNGKVVSYRLYAAARRNGVSEEPNSTQLQRLREAYTKAGWVFSDAPNSPCAWLFEYPKGKP